jgi:CRP-like cAMP-binding protein
MSDPLIDYLTRRDRLSDDEVEAVKRLTQHQQDIPAHHEIVAQGSRPERSCLLVSGMAFRQHFLRDGKRMISAVHISGDFVDLHSFLLDEMDHSVITAANPCRVCWVPHVELRRLTETHPHLARMLWMSTVIDAAISRTALTVLGRLAPAAKLAHLACELYLRLEVVGQAQDYRFDFPVTQIELADIFGLSAVHLNRSLQTLRATGALSWDGRQVVIHNWQRLVDLAQFEPAYLNLRQRPI